MKILSFVILIMMVFCATRGYSMQEDTTIKDTIIVNKYGDFLFESSVPMKVDFIIKGKPIEKEISKGDTLYHDSKYTILGDMSEVVGMGIFKKYVPRSRFEAFKVSVYKGKLAMPDFKTDPAALEFRTVIKRQCKNKGINFAGHFTVVEWGCGTECENIAIINRINGEIYYSDISYESDEGYWGTKYQADSRLIIVNSYNLEDYKGYELCRNSERLKLYFWVDSSLKQLSK